MRFRSTLTGVRGAMRLSFGAVLVLAAALMTVIHSLRPNRAKELQFKKAWSRQVLRALGITLQCVGTAPTSSPNRKGELITCNHITFIDIFVINAVSPSTFVSKSDVTAWPLIGQMARRVGTIFLDRGSRRAAHRTQELIVENLLNGNNIALFPEGTTSDGLSLLPFHGALFQAAIDSEAHVRCASICYLDGSGEFTSRPAYVGNLSLAECLWNIVTTSGLQARIEWAAPIAPPHQDRRHLAKHAHRIIAHQLPQMPKTESPKSP